MQHLSTTSSAPIEKIHKPLLQRGVRQYYTCRRLLNDWRPLLPPGFALRPVDAALLASERLPQEPA
jgi:hypothetical protein